MKHWLNQHQQAFKLVLQRIFRHKLASLMMFCVIGIALCLPGVLFVIVNNLNQLAGEVQSEPQISLFLKLDAGTDTIKALDTQLKKNPEVKSYRFVSKETAWEQLQQNENTSSVGLSLSKNPLPDAYFVHPKELNPEKISQLQTEMQSWDGVDLAQADSNWIKRLFSILELGKKAVFLLAALFGFALVAIIGNTTRLQIVTQHEEIEVSRLMGATDGFIRRPFLYAGAFYGLGGGTVACLMLSAVIAIFNQSVAEISALYASDFSLSLPDIQITTVLVLSATFLGWLGSYFAVGRSLAKLDNV